MTDKYNHNNVFIVKMSKPVPKAVHIMMCCSQSSLVVW